ncbi:RNA polymerase sigma factor [Actinosynnema sp. CS-041913]|uniref:RNA polymerase sigma factor n=1 Tax=Actinosynnema sp. CS-041913 TaxID=3239917 RepID=UPI003D8A0C16
MTGRSDRRAEFAAFFNDNYKRLQLLAARLGVAESDRDELVQETLSKVLGRWDEIEGSAYSYARVVLANAVKKGRTRPGVRQVPLEEHHLTTWADEADRPLTGELLEEGIEQLPSRLQTVMQLHLAGLDNGRIAAETGLGRSSVATYLSQARKRLRGLIGSAGDAAEADPHTADGGDA